MFKKEIIVKNCVIYCSVPNEFNANLIATTLVEDKLAACVNIIPQITSVYRWEGITQTDNVATQKDSDISHHLKPSSAEANVLLEKTTNLGNQTE